VKDGERTRVNLPVVFTLKFGKSKSQWLRIFCLFFHIETQLTHYYESSEKLSVLFSLSLLSSIFVMF